jgi:hypothetical protein
VPRFVDRGELSRVFISGAMLTLQRSRGSRAAERVTLLGVNGIDHAASTEPRFDDRGETG